MGGRKKQMKTKMIRKERNIPPKKSRDCNICFKMAIDRSFTSCCKLMYCFECIRRLGKKSKCPTCDKIFPYIIHNISGPNKFDVYKFESDKGEEFTTVSQTCSAFKAGKNFPALIVGETQNAPPVSRSIPSFNDINICIFRKHIYEQNLKASSPLTGIWDYRLQNSQNIQNLTPWIRRDLRVIIPHTMHDYSFVLTFLIIQFTNECLSNKDIFNVIDKYTAPHTEHFFHELFAFDMSGLNMNVYDLVTMHSNRVTEISSPVSVPGSSESD